MQSFFSSFGIEWSHLLAQLVNFGILVFVLWKLVYKPILKVLDDRQKAAKDALEKSSAIDAKLLEIKALEEKAIAEARERGEKLVKDVEASAVNLKKKLSDEATAFAQKIVSDAKAEMRSEQEQLNAEFKKEVIGIVATAIEATVGKYLDHSARQGLAEEASKEALKVERLVK